MAKLGIRVLYMVASPNTKLCRIMRNINEPSSSSLPTRYSEAAKSLNMGGLLRGYFTIDGITTYYVPILLPHTIG